MALKSVGAKLILEGEGSFIRGMNKASGSVDNFESNVKGTSVTTIAFGTALGNLATGGLALVGKGMAKVTQLGVGFLADSVGKAADLETQMSGVNAVLGATDEEMTSLKGLVSDLGLDPNLKVSSLEAAAAIEVLAKNGIEVAEIMDGAARSTVALSNATGADFTIAADIATDAMVLFNIKASDMETAIDGITGVTTASKFDINDYGLALSNAGGIAAGMGVSFSDLNTVLVASASSFSGGSDAGTSFKIFLQRLAAPTDKMKKTLDELGISLFDESGQMREMGDVIGQLNGAFSTMTEAQRAQTATAIGGADASRTVLALAGLTKTGFVALSATVNATGQAQDAAATRVDNFAGAMDILAGIVEDVKIQIGTALLPALTTMAKTISEFVANNSAPFIDFFTRAGQGIQAFVEGLTGGQGFIESFLSGLAAFGIEGPELVRIREFITEIIDLGIAITTFVSDNAETFKTVLISIGAILAGAAIISGITAVVGAIGLLISPIGLVVAGVVALGAAWATNWGGIQEKTQTVIGFITGFITSSFQSLQEFWETNGGEIKETISKTWTTVQEIFDNVWGTISTVIEKAIEIIRPAISIFVENASGALEKFGPLLDTLGELWVALEPVVTIVLGAIGAALLASIGVAVGMVTGISEAIGPLIETFRNVATGIITALTGIAEFVTGFVELIVGLFQGNGEAVAEAWSKMGSGIMKIVKGLVFGVVGLITGFIDTIFSLIGGFVSGIIDFFTGLSDVLVGNSIITDMFSAILAATVTFVADFMADIGNMINGVIAFFKKNIMVFVSIGNNIIGGIVSGILDSAGRVVGTLKSVVDAAVGSTKRALGIGSASKVFGAIGIDIVGGIQLGVDKEDGIFDPILAQAKALGTELSGLQLPVMLQRASPEGERGIVGGREQPVMPPATANQINSNNVTQDNSTATTVNFANNSGGTPISDASELQFVLAQAGV